MSENREKLSKIWKEVVLESKVVLFGSDDPDHPVNLFFNMMGITLKAAMVTGVLPCVLSILPAAYFARKASTSNPQKNNIENIVKKKEKLKKDSTFDWKPIQNQTNQCLEIY